MKITCSKLRTRSWKSMFELKKRASWTKISTFFLCQVAESSVSTQPFKFRKTSLFEQLVHISTAINKSTPRSIVSKQFLSIFLSHFLSSLPCPVVLPRPRKANKPSNSSGIASSAPYRFEQQQVPHSYIPSRPFPKQRIVSTSWNYAKRN